jgi:hypothetical protein
MIGRAGIVKSVGVRRSQHAPAPAVRVGTIHPSAPVIICALGAAKKRARAINCSRDRAKRVQHYRQLIKLTQGTLAYADHAAAQVWQAPDAMGLDQTVTKCHFG